MPAKIYLIEQLGDSTIMNLDINEKIIKLKSSVNKNFKENSEVFVKINTDKIYLFDPDTGLRI
jgi:ABC-type sugar transport system ATPase subunit